MDLRDRQAHLAELMADQMGLVRKKARPWRWIIMSALALAAAGTSVGTRHLSVDHSPWLVPSIGTAVLFFVLGVLATLGLAGKAHDVLKPRIGTAHSTLIRVVLVITGWALVITVTLDLLGVPIERLILGGALTGVIIGIAAQQSLANLFAGVVLLLSRPFEVGDEIRLHSGALGGPFEGRIVEIGLTYVRMETEDGIMSLPNAQVLSAATGPKPAEPDQV